MIWVLSLGKFISFCWSWGLKPILGIASAPLSGLIGKYGFDATTGKCHILNCNVASMFNLPAGGITLSLGVGLPCIIVVMACIVIFMRFGCCIIRYGEEVKYPKEVQYIIAALVWSYLIFILPIYIIEWVPYRPGFSALATILVYTW